MNTSNPSQAYNEPLWHVVTGAASGTLVWQVDAPADYEPFATIFASGARDRGKPVIQFHFGDIPALPPGNSETRVHSICPQAGFEPFISDVLNAIQQQGNNACYLFDCISPLAADWFSDQMVGNFFMIVCGALRAIEGAACFAVLRNHHSHYALDPVTNTANALFDVCRHDQRLYVQPLKIAYNNIACRHILHAWEAGQGLAPVRESHIAATVLTRGRRDNLGLARHHLGVWSRTFVEAETLLDAQRTRGACEAQVQAMRDRILRMAVTRDARVLQLVQQYFSLEDLVFLGTRMLGTGLIGGKAADMLLARAALVHHDPRWNQRLETHDSFFIPSDVFYTFLVQNDCWELRRNLLKAPERADIAKELRRRIYNGIFPPHIIKRFSDMLDYFGETPLAIRSSSLLEDSFGNAFAGKYESVFCVNQGGRDARLDELIQAIKTVYASAMSREALAYRATHRLLERDEQMAILVQRVAGTFRGGAYFPDLSAVGFSFNPYVWHEDIDPRAGVLRMVFGLGTRAVNRVDDDFTRLVALNAPLLRPEHHDPEMPAPAQQRADVLDLKQGGITSTTFRDLVPLLPQSVLRLIATEDTPRALAERRAPAHQLRIRRLSFTRLLKTTDFAATVQEMLRILETTYGCPVDVEFAVNFSDDGAYRIHLLQCRPMQVKGLDHPALPNTVVADDRVMLRSGGPVIGRSRLIPIHHVLYVVPAHYARLPEREQYALARIIGECNRRIATPDTGANTMLVGPGRWGSTMPALGLPVSFSEINRVAAICEILAIRDDLVTEVSLGTHFFNDLVEMDMLYMALRPGDPQGRFDADWFETEPNRLSTLIPEATRFEKVLRVLDCTQNHAPQLFLRAETPKQQACLYRK